MTRPEILDTAKKCVCGDREQSYGSPENNFSTIARLWTAYKGIELTAVDVAIFLSLVKIGRIASGRGKADNWIDLAGYAACGGEIESNIPAPSNTTMEHETCADVITPETLEELFRGYTNATVEPVKGKYEGLSNFELDELFCPPTPCNKCPVLVRARELDISCNGFIVKHPKEFRKIAIEWLNKQDELEWKA